MSINPASIKEYQELKKQYGKAEKTNKPTFYFKKKLITVAYANTYWST